jgi:predicted negative regulator of RcsB-dependent stress response
MTEEHLPDRRKHGYRELETKLDHHYEELELRLKRFFSKCLIAFAIMGISTAVSLFGFGLVLKQHQDLTKQIQEQRRNSVFEACRSQNQRHDDTVAKLKALPDFNPSAQAATISLIDSLAPKQNCQQLAQAVVEGDGG